MHHARSWQGRFDWRLHLISRCSITSPHLPLATIIAVLVPAPRIDRRALRQEIQVFGAPRCRGTDALALLLILALGIFFGGYQLLHGRATPNRGPAKKSDVVNCLTARSGSSEYTARDFRDASEVWLCTIT